MNNLVGILLRFRKGRYCMMADIEKMFHQVLVREQDEKHCDLCGAQTRNSNSETFGWIFTHLGKLTPHAAAFGF